MHFPILTGCFSFCLSFSVTKLIMPPQLLSNEFLFQAFIVPQTPPSPDNSLWIRCQVCLLKEPLLVCRKPMEWSPGVCHQELLFDINNQELIIPEIILSLQYLSSSELLGFLFLPAWALRCTLNFLTSVLIHIFSAQNSMSSFAIFKFISPSEFRLNLTSSIRIYPDCPALNDLSSWCLDLYHTPGTNFSELCLLQFHL